MYPHSEHIGDPQGHNKSSMQSVWVRSLLGSLVVGICVSACMSELSEPEEKESPNQLVERQAPESGEYFLDTNDRYYRYLADMAEKTSDSQTRESLDELSKIPITQWLNGPIGPTVQIIEENIKLSTIQGGIPTFALYNIPNRDLGGEARGGLITPEEYQDWVESISQTIADYRSIVILEPDALAGIPQMNNEVQVKERIDMLHYAAEYFKQHNSNMAVYLDAGHSRWVSAKEMARLINEVDKGNDLVGGIALNVSNQRPEEELKIYVDELWRHLGRQVFVILDNSMNGAQDSDALLEWCNNKSERIGAIDDTYFDATLPIEEMYIKAPGESDGKCGQSSRPSGEFDEQLLLNQISKKGRIKEGR